MTTCTETHDVDLVIEYRFQDRADLPPREMPDPDEYADLKGKYRVASPEVDRFIADLYRELKEAPAPGSSRSGA